jgi:hypothetical protein
VPCNLDNFPNPALLAKGKKHFKKREISSEVAGS